MEYRLVYKGSYDQGKIITSILKENDLVKVIISNESKKKKDNQFLWLTYIWDEKEKKINMQFNGYMVDIEKHLVPRVEKNELKMMTQQHENIVNMLLEDLVKEG
jgi:exosome complex RNA-binding protein Rrp4